MNCAVTIRIRESDPVLGLSPKQWDDDGNPLPDLSGDEFQKLVDAVKGKTQFDIDMECNGNMRRIRSPLTDPENREMILQQSLYASMKAISSQFDNLCR